MKIFEASYFVFFLPIWSYDEHRVRHYFKTSLFLSILAITQLIFLYTHKFIEKHQRKYFLIFRSLGYWVEIELKDIPQTIKGQRIEVWYPKRSPSELRHKFYLAYKGKYYKKLSFLDSFSFWDRMTMEFILNTHRFALIFYSVILAISLSQIYLAFYFFKELNVAIQIGLSTLLLII